MFDGFTSRPKADPLKITVVREWVERVFVLPSEAHVAVTELHCTEPGCPPLETVIAFWIGEQRHHLKLFKPVAEVTPNDLPPSWFRSALAVDVNFDGDCC